MSIDRWIALDPWKAMDRMLNETSWSVPRPRTGPRVRFRIEGDAFELRAPLPGVRKEDIELTVEDDVVTLKATRQPRAPEGFEPRRRERTEQSFERSYRLPETIDGTKVEARLENGVLVAMFPKKAQDKPRTIAVRAA